MKYRQVSTSLMIVSFMSWSAASTPCFAGTNVAIPDDIGSAVHGYQFGGSSGEQSGISVSTTGDFDGDGKDDILIGAANWGPLGKQEGRAHLVYGGQGFSLDQSLVDLTDIGDLAAGATYEGASFQGVAGSLTYIFTLTSPFSHKAGENAGFAVSFAGDVNGDGFDDILIGAPLADVVDPDDPMMMLNGAGRVYLIYGRPRVGPDPLLGIYELAEVDGAGGNNTLPGRSAVFEGAATEASVTKPLAAFAGKTALEVVAEINGLSPIPTDPNYVSTGDFVGGNVAGVGDFNGDGFDDFLIGGLFANKNRGCVGDPLPLGCDGPEDSAIRIGEAYLIYGKPLSDPKPLTGRLLLRNVDGVKVAGQEAALPDRIAGAVFQGVTSSNIASTGTVDDPDDPDPLGRITISNPINAGDRVGEAMSPAGDFNKDGVVDLLLGVPYAHVLGGASIPDKRGRSCLVYGIPGTPGNTYPISGAIPLNTVGDTVNGTPGKDGVIPSTTGIIFYGTSFVDHSGRSVADLGDVNGDLVGDILISADYRLTYSSNPLVNPEATEEFQQWGETYLIYGRSHDDPDGALMGEIELYAIGDPDPLSSNPPVDPNGLPVPDTMRVKGAVFKGTLRHDRSGEDVSSAGDFNGDGLTDFLIAGRFGLSLDPDTGATTPNAGKAYLVFGQSGANELVGFKNLADLDGGPLQGLFFSNPNPQSADFLGSALSFMDANGDEFADAVISGQMDENPGGFNNRGVTYVIFGRPNGDLNGDGFVGVDDLNLVLGNWNQNIPPGDPRADPSGDGFVGVDDLNTVLGNWNKGTPPALP